MLQWLTISNLLMSKSKAVKIKNVVVEQLDSIFSMFDFINLIGTNFTTYQIIPSLI